MTAVGRDRGSWHDPAMRTSSAVLWWGSLLVGLATASAASANAQTPIPAVVSGRVESHPGLDVLRVWGSDRDRGYAHGRLLAARIVAVALPEFQHRFGRLQPLLVQVRQAQGRLIEYPEPVRHELEGLWQGLVDSGVDLHMPELERAFDFTDLLVANALDVFGLMGCSSFTLCGEQVEGGGVLTARNFDWPLTGPHLLEHTILVVQHLDSGRAVASVSWPGFVGTVTGVSRDGLAAFLHVGSAKITYTPEPSSWPTAIAARAILAGGVGTDAAATWAFAREQLGYTSPPGGFLTHLVLPVAPAAGAPAMVFEADAKKVVPGASPAANGGAAGAGATVVTNHFRTRTDGRTASGDSLQREKRLEKGIGQCLAADDKKLSRDEVWQLLGEVQRGGGHAFGTLHALVFRHEPWCFELRIAELGADGIVAAPASGRQVVLSREQVFPAALPVAQPVAPPAGRPAGR